MPPPRTPRARHFVAAFLIAACAFPAWAIPTFDEVKRGFQPSDTLVLDRQGEVLQRVRTDASVRRGQWIELADVSPALRTALVLSEDRRFYEHSGVDWQAVSAAAWANLWNQRTRGASTLTMQLAGLLDSPDLPDLRQRPGGRGVAQKLGQTVVAQVLERRWRKAQILEAYLNLVPFRGELVGMDALSRTLFGKAAHGLDAREAAVAAALVRAPNAQPAVVAQRACGVLRQMQAQARAQVDATAPVHSAQGAQGAAAGVDCDALDMFASAALQRRDYPASDGVAPHFARRVLAQAQAQVKAPAASAVPDPASAPLPARITSTLRAPLQRFAVQTLAQHLGELRGGNVEDGAIVVLDNASGEVLAWVGSSGPLGQAQEVDGVLAQRQPGSTLKPFLYAQAIAERRLTAASLIEDSPAHLATTSGLYIPQNYDRQFKGWVSVRTALAASLNVPAVRTLVMVSPDAFFRQLQAVGLPLRESGGYFGYSLALGSSEVQLLHLTNAYRTLANGGRFSPVAPALLPARPTAPVFTRALNEHAAFIAGDVLSDGNARARTFGTDSVLATRFWTAVKTGTSKDMRDNWAVGWSARYTVGVWVGNASGAAMHDVSGSSGAAPVWAAVMAQLHAREPSRAPLPPRGLVQVAVRFGALPGSPAPLEAARSEWFVPGTQQPLFAMDSEAASAYHASARGPKGLKISGEGTDLSGVRIATPTAGTVIALDPDIPPARQRLRFAASPHPLGATLRWRLDGQPLGQGAQLAWLPWPGRHRVQLTDARGVVLDEVRLEVRGAGVRQSTPRR
ncbi:MAG: penicillin-binding protein 1C [Simplicispira sp.]|nr:penicillin-binding protein 1C [Simplicispira sp.]